MQGGFLAEIARTLRETVRLPWDLVDIGILALAIYWILDLIKGTRAVQMLWGMAVVFLAYFAAQHFGLVATQWILSNFLGSIVLVVIVLFQHDIRRALAQMGRNPFLSNLNPEQESQFFDEVCRAAQSLASKRIGALVVLERRTGLKEYLEGGTPMDANVTWELLLSIFHPSSPLHDGAVIIRQARVDSAGCFLPLSMSPMVSRSLGTRHRAALGLSEETDAAVIVVSEETGVVSLAVEGKLRRDLQPTDLRDALRALFAQRERRRWRWPGARRGREGPSIAGAGSLAVEGKGDDRGLGEETVAALGEAAGEPGAVPGEKP